MSRVSLALVLGAALAFAGASTAKADTIDYLLNEGNSGLTGTNSGPYGDVLVNRTSSTTATIAFTAYTGFLFAQAQVAGVNLNATSWTISPGFSGTNSLSGFTAGTASNGGSQNEDGFGSFNQTFDDSGGYSNGWQTFTFTVTDTSGTWASAASVLKANNKGNEVGAHVGICDSLPDACARDGSFTTTGFASSDGTTVSVPGPILGGGLPGLIAACTGLVAFARRRRLRLA